MEEAGEILRSGRLADESTQSFRYVKRGQGASGL